MNDARQPRFLAAVMARFRGDSGAPHEEVAENPVPAAPADPEPPPPREVLDEIGIAEGTDKSSLLHDYLRHYELLFAPMRSDTFNLIEIGVQGGRSTRTWNRFFPHATIVGIDILEMCRRHAGGRVVIEIGSQADPEFLSGVCDRYPPRIVIDDGSHQAEHILTSFACMFPRLAPGGWYVIEDVPIHGGVHELLTRIGFDVRAERGEYNGQVDEIMFIRGAAFLRKADRKAEVAGLDSAESMIADSSDSEVWKLLSFRMTKKFALHDRAEAAIRKAIAFNPRRASLHIDLSRVLMAKRDAPQALQEVETALEKTQAEGRPVPEAYLSLRADIRKRLGRAPADT